MRVHLTDAVLRNLPVPAKGQADFWDASFKGGAFGVRVSQGGSKTFVVNIRGKSRRSIGTYPLISLSEARGEAKRLFAELTLGKTLPPSISHSAALQEFLDEKSRAKRPRTVDGYERLIKRLGFSGNMADITHEEAARKLNRITAPAMRSHEWPHDQSQVWSTPCGVHKPLPDDKQRDVVGDDVFPNVVGPLPSHLRHLPVKHKNHPIFHVDHQRHNSQRDYRRAQERPPA